MKKKKKQGKERKITTWELPARGRGHETNGGERALSFKKGVMKDL